MKAFADVALKYEWAVYKDAAYEPTLSVSASLDPRNFKLPSYSLDSAAKYTVILTVNIPGSSKKQVWLSYRNFLYFYSFICIPKIYTQIYYITDLIDRR